MNHIIAHAYHMPKLRDYILERTGWTTDIFNSVDWDVTELYMKSLPDTTRTNAVKYPRLAKYWETEPAISGSRG